MNKTTADFRRLSRMYLGAVLLFAAFGILTLAVSRLEHLRPDTQVFSPHFFSQLLGAHRLLLHFFVALPGLMVVIGFASLRDRKVGSPRLAGISLILFVLGGALVLWSFIWGKIETGWLYAVAFPMTRDLASGELMLGLLLGAASLMMNGWIIARALGDRAERRERVFFRSLYWAGWCAAAGMLLVCLVLTVGLLDRYTPLALFSTAMEGSAPWQGLLAAMAESPMKVMVLLPALGVLCEVLDPEAGRLRGSGMFPMIAFVSLLALDPRGVPLMEPGFMVHLGSLFRGILMVLVLGMVISLLLDGIRKRMFSGPSGLYAMGACLLILFAGPLDFFVGLPVNSFYAASYLGSASYYLLSAGAGFLAFMAALYHGAFALTGKSVIRMAPSLFALVVLAGLGATFLPMIVMGLRGVSMDLAVYPSGLLPLQVLATAGGTILCLGMFGAGMSLRRSGA